MRAAAARADRVAAAAAAAAFVWKILPHLVSFRLTSLRLIIDGGWGRGHDGTRTGLNLNLMNIIRFALIAF